VPRRKIVNYLLNEAHADGGPKARFFRAFGFDLNAPDVMAEALHAHPDRNPVKGQTRTASGVISVVECHFSTPDGRDPCIRSIWHQATGSDVQSLVSAYPFERR